MGHDDKLWNCFIQSNNASFNWNISEQFTSNASIQYFLQRKEILFFFFLECIFVSYFLTGRHWVLKLSDWGFLGCQKPYMQKKYQEDVECLEILVLLVVWTSTVLAVRPLIIIEALYCTRRGLVKRWDITPKLPAHD